jgi:hypothetical protein
MRPVLHDKNISESSATDFAGGLVLKNFLQERFLAAFDLLCWILYKIDVNPVCTTA